MSSKLNLTNTEVKTELRAIERNHLLEVLRLLRDIAAKEIPATRTSPADPTPIIPESKLLMNCY